MADTLAGCGERGAAYRLALKVIQRPTLPDAIQQRLAAYLDQTNEHAAS